jgi:hypothetical protein
MRIETMDQHVTMKDLRHFGLMVGGIFILIAIWPLVFRGEPLRIWAAGVGASLAAAGALFPTGLAPLYRGWMWVGHVLGWINTRILLGVVFYGLVMPIGLCLRMMGRNTVRQQFAEAMPTYRVVRAPRPRNHMKNQF